MKNLVIQIVNRPDGGGAEYLARTINQELSDFSFDTFLIFFHNPKKINLNENEYLLGKIHPYNPINIIKLFLFVTKKAKRYKKVILQGHLTHSLYFLIPFSFFSKFILFYTEHNSFNKRRKIQILRPLERFIYSRYERIISISPYVKDQLIKWLGKNKINKDKFIVVFNGTKLYPYRKREFNKKKFNLLSIGSLTTQKGFDLSINAVSELREYIENYYILGEGPKRELLENLILKLKLSKIVKLKGFSDPEIYLDKCDLGLIPSKWEGFGLVSVEMVSSGMPLLISDVNGMSDLFYNLESVKIVKDREISSWSNEIKNLIVYLKKNKGVLKKSSQSVRQFSISNMVDNYKKEYLKFF